MKVFKLIVPASLNYSESVRMVSMEIGEDAGFEKREKNMIRLVIDELFMNAVKYGSNKESTVLIEGGFEGDSVFFAVEDEGKGATKMKAEDLLNIINEEKSNTDLQKTHGRGLAQITGVMTTSFEVKDGKLGGIRIEFTKKRGDRAPENIIKKVKSSSASVSEGKSHKRVDRKEFELSGDIDLHNLEEISSPIDDYVNRIGVPVEVTLKCRDLNYCNSTFIGKIAEWHSLLSTSGGELKLVGVNEQLFEILDLVGLTQLLSIEV